MTEPQHPRSIPTLASAPIDRRAFLAALAGGAMSVACSLAMPRVARAAESPPTGSRIKSASKSPQGTTLFLELEHAPFPAPHDATVIVFVPSHFRYAAGEKLCSVVHFHGINSTAEEAMNGNQLREQFYESRQNAILVVPQGLKHSPDCSFGNLEQEGGLSRMLTDMKRVLTSHEAARELGAAAIPHGAPNGIVCLSTHSGGYHGVAACLQHGGVPISEVYLFDALYADTQSFRDWVLASRGHSPKRRHKLISYFPPSGTTATQNRLLKEQLEKAGIKCAFESVEGMLSRRELSHEQAIFVQTALSHSQVTWESNALRDCLFASILPRRVKSSWFKVGKSKPSRPIDERR